MNYEIFRIVSDCKRKRLYCMVQIAGVGLLLMWRYNAMLSFHYKKFFLLLLPLLAIHISFVIPDCIGNCNATVVCMCVFVLVLRFHAFIALAIHSIHSAVYQHTHTRTHKQACCIISLIILFHFYCAKFDPAVVISFVLFIHMSS